PYISRLERRGQISSLFYRDRRRRSTACSDSFLVGSGARSARRVPVSSEIRFRHVFSPRHLGRCRALVLAASARQQRPELGRSGPYAESASGTRCWRRSPALGHSPALLRCFADCIARLLISARLCLAAFWQGASCRDQRSVHRRALLPRNLPGHLAQDWSKAAI